MQIANIIPPEPGMHVLYFVFTNANPGAFLNSGNIVSTSDPAQNVVVTAVYDPISGDYYIGPIS